tara:strand:- start:30 stop:323 length:294 start_codon:yes stop_codon:yes gene_type:complete
MAQVTSSTDMTVIVLDNDEAEALGDLLDSASRNHEGYWTGRLDELTNTMLGEKMAFGYEGSCEEGEEGTANQVVTNWDKPEPSWKDEPSSDYRFGRG